MSPHYLLSRPEAMLSTVMHNAWYPPDQWWDHPESTAEKVPAEFGFRVVPGARP